jgi:CheY-like chemotaxis protein
MPDGGRLIVRVDEETIREGGILPPGLYVRLRLSDTGTGMDEETLKRATEPFFTTKGVGKGTGLGLSMIHGLAQQSGGRFNLRSELGRGTTAEILLPQANPQDQSLGEPVPERIVDQIASANKPLSVLVVDDDGIVLIGTCGMLEDLGHHPVEARSGPEALGILRSRRSVDVVLTDQVMPGMTGVQLASAVAAEWPGLPVVVASGYAELPESATRLAVERLSKPYHQADLAKTAGAVRSGKVVPLRPG